MEQINELMKGLDTFWKNKLSQTVLEKVIKSLCVIHRSKCASGQSDKETSVWVIFTLYQTTRLVII